MCRADGGGVPSRSGVAVGLRPGWCRQWGSMWHGAWLMFRSQPLLSRGGTSTPCSPSAPWEQDPGQTYLTHIPSLQPSGNHSQAWADFPILPASSLQMQLIRTHFPTCLALTPSHAWFCLTLSFHFTDLVTEAQRGEGSGPAHTGRFRAGDLNPAG